MENRISLVTRLGPENLHGHVRRVLAACALVSLLFLPFDLLHEERWSAIAWRSLWVLLLGAAAWLQDSAHPRRSSIVLHLAGLASGVLGGLIVLHADGSLGPRLGFLLALGPTVLILIPDQPWTALLTGIASLGFATGIMIRDGRPAAYVVEWLALASALGVLSVFGARWFRSNWIGRLRAERERALALERLQVSERRRIDAEHLADLGRLAGEVAHALSNPLAAVKADLRWLESVHAGGEPRSVLADTEEGVRRITRIVDDMRALATEAPAVSAADAGGILSHARKLIVERHPDAPVVMESPGPDLPPVAASPDRLSRAVAHLVAHALGTAGAPGARFTVDVRRDGNELAFRVVGPPVPAGPQLVGSLDWSLANGLAAQGNGVLDPFTAPGAAGWVLRVPVAEAVHVTPAPLPLAARVE